MSRAEPAHQPRGHRRRLSSATRSEAAPGHGRAHRPAERCALRPGPDEPGADPGQAGQRRRRARGREDQGQGRLRRAGGRRRSRPARPRRSMRRARASARASRPSASAARFWTPWRSKTSSRSRTPKARGWSRAWSSTSSDYDVDIMNLQKRDRPVTDQTPNGLLEIALENGASLKSRTVILAHRRALAADERPGRRRVSQSRRGLLPALRRPALQGQARGGDRRRQFSGVEAAIDLAGVAAHVTLIEFDADLRADAVLQRKLASLPNVTDHHLGPDHRGPWATATQGDRAHATRIARQRLRAPIDLEGVFVQIGLVPNTEWLKDAVALTRRGEIEVDRSAAKPRCPASSPPAMRPRRPTSRSSSPWAMDRRLRCRPSTT